MKVGTLVKNYEEFLDGEQHFTKLGPRRAGPCALRRSCAGDAGPALRDTDVTARRLLVSVPEQTDHGD